jgi:hypothetical protein
VSVAAIAISSSLAGCNSVSSGATAPRRLAAAPSAPAVASPAAVATTTPAPRQASPRPARTQAATGDVLVGDGGIVLPSRRRTPGASNAAVTQATIQATICRVGYTKTIRPSSSVTTALKRQQLATGYAYKGDLDTSDYEEDHLISLELGGSPTSPQNLWPEPYAAAGGARIKDRIENRLHDLVCSRRLPLRVAQQAIAVNWWKAYRTYGGTGTTSVWDGSYGSSETSASSGGSGGTSGTSGASAQCRDGSYSYSHHRSGTCSRHGGVDHWINPPPS